jgi:uncharacterized protein HemX
MGAGRALLLGAAVGVVLALGLGLILSGQARSLRKRRERNRTLKGTNAENRRLAAEREAQKARAHEAEVARADEAATEADRAEASEADRAAAYPDENRRGGAEYVLGSKYPQDSSATTPPSPPGRAAEGRL